MRAVFDTCVLFDDLPMTGLRSRTILDQCSRGGFEASIPEVVVGEMVNHARERIDGALARIGNGTASLGRLGLSAGTSPRPGAILAREFERRLRERLKAHRVEIPGYPAVDHATLVERSIAGRRPFRTSDRGYRDTLIWHNVLDAAANEEIALVTSNTQDFADASKTGVHPHLLDDTTQVRSKPVALFTSLDDFIAAHVPSSDQVLQQAQHLLESDSEFDEALRSAVGDALADTTTWPYHSDVTVVDATEGESMVGEESPDSMEVEELILLDAPELVRALELDEDDLFVLEVDVRAEMRFHLVFGPAAGEWLVERGSNVDFYDQSESYWAGYSTGLVLGRLGVPFDRETAVLGEVELTELRDLPRDDPHRP